MADSNVMMALGDYRFSLSTAAYQNLERTMSWRWAAVERVGGRPKQQYIGPGEETVSMDGSIYPAFRGGLGQIDRMRVEANKGEARLLVDGTGKVWGRYCITEIRETQTVFFSNGKPRKVDFAISLKHYGDDA